MIRTEIKKELERREWTAKKLAEETGVRYASVTGFLNTGKELSITNLEKILNVLGMETKKKSGSKAPDYKALVKAFDGEHILSPTVNTSMYIGEDEMAAFFLGVLAHKASTLGGGESKNWTLGDTIERCIAYEEIADEDVVDIPKSVQKPFFANIALTLFNEKERQLMALLSLHEYGEDTDRKRLDVPLLAGIFNASADSDFSVG